MEIPLSNVAVRLEMARAQADAINSVKPDGSLPTILEAEQYKARIEVAKLETLIEIRNVLLNTFNASFAKPATESKTV